MQARAYNEGWVDGVEIINSTSLYPTVARRCIDNKLFMAANTDAHRPTAQVWGGTNEFFRTMTFIMATKCTEEAIKEALKAQRTIGYSGNHLVGQQRYLVAFFNAAVECRKVATNKQGTTYSFTNLCSVPFLLEHKNNTHKLEPFRSLTFTFKQGEEPSFVVANMWHIDEQHPTITVAVD